MFRRITNHKSTASITKTNRVVVMCDDGWEDILDYYVDFGSEQEARDYLAGAGFEEYDPNAALKAAGLKWNGYCYA